MAEHKNADSERFPGFGAYVRPKKNILVLSCMDLRFTDDLLQFLHHDNLENRYDLFTLAGASLCACMKPEDRRFRALARKNFASAWQLFEAHLEAAVQLHDIRDVYIVEHMNCGAYKEFLSAGATIAANPSEEKNAHERFSAELAAKITGKKFYDLKYKPDPAHKDRYLLAEKSEYRLRVLRFLIGLAGEVSLLEK